MKTTPAAQRSTTPGLKTVISTAAVVATLAGWAALAADQPPTLAVAQAAPTLQPPTPTLQPPTPTLQPPSGDGTNPGSAASSLPPIPTVVPLASDTRVQVIVQAAVVAPPAQPAQPAQPAPAQPAPPVQPAPAQPAPPVVVAPPQAQPEPPPPPPAPAATTRSSR